MLIVSLSTYADTNANENKNESKEIIEVTSRRPDYLHHLQDVLPVSEVLSADSNQAAITSFGSAADMLVSDPQVNFNGQGGLFQTVSIRGLSRWRVQTLVEGIPIQTERRAGNTAEFIAPGMIGRAYVLPGAASTQLGSGALGGGIDMRLVETLDTRASFTTALQQDYREFQTSSAFSLGDINSAPAITWGINTRHANNSEDADGNLITDGFEQSMAFARYKHSEEQQLQEALILFSSSNNVAKASSDDISERFTEYPSNEHWLAKVQFDWLNAKVYAHHSSLDTRIVRVENRENQLSNSALGWGVSLSEQFEFLSQAINWKIAVDVRSNVDAQEREISSFGDLVFNRTNLQAQQQAWSVSFDTVKRLKHWDLAGGLRLEHMRQESDSPDNPHTSNDTNTSVFFSATRYITDNLSSNVYVSSAFRVPNLTERYFSGSTPRGETFGDVNLQTEHARNVQIALDYQRASFSINLSTYRQNIDNYIERIDISDTLRQYANLGNAIIKGFSYTIHWQVPHWKAYNSGKSNKAAPPTTPFYIDLSGQRIRGEDNTGIPINDISPNQHTLTVGYQHDKLDASLDISYREQFDTPGTSELALNSVVFLNAAARYYATQDLTAQIQISNLTNRLYSVSTDDLSPQARGRDLQVKLSYVF